MARNRIKMAMLAVSVLIIALLIVYADPGKFAQLLAKSDYRFVLAAVLLSSFNILVLRILKWQLLLEKESFATVVPVQLLGVTISNLSPGKIAEPIKSVILKLHSGKPVSSSLPSVIWERILDLISLIFLSFVAMFFFTTIDTSLFLISLAGTFIFILIIIVAVGFLYSRRIRNWVLRIVKKLPVLKNISEGFMKNFAKIKIPRKRLFYSFVVTLAAWLIEGVLLWLVFLALGISLSPLFLASIFALATVIGVITALPGGIGSTEIVMTLFLGAVGIDYSTAIAGVLLYRFLSIWYFNLLGGISLVYITKKLRISYNSLLS
ncbi:MAG: flippase-like domain-containing protein [Candidatus Aenigmarchaeota archaeon]|nr:flippase-like domain-containing protein [Candidatus Aenigmarchaeota archaeon]